jgi:hypothetical protein
MGCVAYSVAQSFKENTVIFLARPYDFKWSFFNG